MKPNFLIGLILTWLFCAPNLLFGQEEEPITLHNPSFEDLPRAGKAPRSWFDCGRINFPSETPPDTHPSGQFLVKTLPQDGVSYLGLVVRENESWEAVSQRLSTPLTPDMCYDFSLYLARSQYYRSKIRGKEEDVNFTAPLKLRIWGGTGYCNKAELLDESKLVINHNWKNYRFEFKPKQRHTYIIIEAFFQTPAIVPPNGNILIDNASAIIPRRCDEPPVEDPYLPKLPDDAVVNQKPTAKPDKPSNPKKDPVVSTPVTPEPEPAIAKVEPKPKKEKLIKELDRRRLREGQTIRIDKLFFRADSSRIEPASYGALEEIYDFMRENKDVIVEVGGHTNRVPPHSYCDRLSKSRAKAVVEYLVMKGIPDERLSYKGYGKRKPVAFGRKPEDRKKNQRVEIKILSLDG